MCTIPVGWLHHEVTTNKKCIIWKQIPNTTGFYANMCTNVGTLKMDLSSNTTWCKREKTDHKLSQHNSWCSTTPGHSLRWPIICQKKKKLLFSLQVLVNVTEIKNSDRRWSHIRFFFFKPSFTACMNLWSVHSVLMNQGIANGNCSFHQWPGLYLDTISVKSSVH